MKLSGNYAGKVTKYERLLMAAQKANAAPEIVAKYAFLFRWARWRFTNEISNSLVKRWGKKEVNKVVREHGHRMSMHYNQLKRMGA